MSYQTWVLQKLLRTSALNQLQMVVVDKKQNNDKELNQFFELQNFQFRVTSVRFRSIPPHLPCLSSYAEALGYKH